MKNKIMLGVFSGLIVVQLVVPLSMILKREVTLRQGAVFRFKTEPVDPYDAFRGRYVALGIEADKAPLPQGLTIKEEQKVYAYIAVDEQGFAHFTAISSHAPRGVPYMTVRVNRIRGGNVLLEVPLDRYYMEETAAPRAERLYREHNRQGKQDAYVVVRVKNGFPVIESLYVGGEKIEDALKRLKE